MTSNDPWPTPEEMERAQRSFEINKAKVMQGDTYRAGATPRYRRGKSPSDYDRHGRR